MSTTYQIRQEGTDQWFSITDEIADTCRDIDYYADANGWRCSDYTTDNGNTPGTYTCDGTNNGVVGFDAAAQCCFCGGGTGMTVPYDFNDFVAYGSSDGLDVFFTTQATFNPAKTFEVRLTHEIQDRNLLITTA